MFWVPPFAIQISEREKQKHSGISSTALELHKQVKIRQYMSVAFYQTFGAQYN